jgi:hypothetical protein
VKILIKNRITDHEYYPFVTTIVGPESLVNNNFGDTHSQGSFVDGAIQLARTCGIEVEVEGHFSSNLKPVKATKPKRKKRS